VFFLFVLLFVCKPTEQTNKKTSLGLPSVGELTDSNFLGGYLGRVSPHRVPRLRHSLGDVVMWFSPHHNIRIRVSYGGTCEQTFRTHINKKSKRSATAAPIGDVAKW